MSKTEKLEPDFGADSSSDSSLFDDFNEDLDADLESDLDLTFDSDIDRYMDTDGDDRYLAIAQNTFGRESDRHHLPGDWQDFDYAADEW